MRKSLLTIGSTILIIALCTYATNSKNRIQKLDRVTYSDGNNIGASGAGGSSFAQTGCTASSGCHGTKVSTAVKGVFSGLPANNQVIAGQTYTLSLVITDKGQKRFGFDIFSSSGTFNTTNTFAEVDTNWASNGFPGAEIHHGSSAPTGTSPYTFDKITWTAPLIPGLDTFYYAANAANGDNLASSADHSMLGKPIYLTVSPSTTPVTLASFNAAYTSNKVTLSWSTATEINTDHFEIERSINARTFSHVGTVKATGNSSSTLEYSYNDNVAGLSGTIYYRLKSVDKNGAFNYSNIKSVVVNSTKNLITNIYPNPVSAGHTIKINYTSIQSSNVTVEMISILGKKVYTTVLPVNEGSNTLSLSAGHLPSGLYYVSVTINGAIQRMPVVIQ